MKTKKEQLDIQKTHEDSKNELFQLELVPESAVLAEKNKRLSLEKEFTKEESEFLIKMLQKIVINQSINEEACTDNK